MKRYIKCDTDDLDFSPGLDKNYCMNLCGSEDFYFSADTPEGAVVKFLTQIMPEVTYDPDWKKDFASDPEDYFALYGNIEYDENGDVYDWDVIYTGEQILKIAQTNGIIKKRRNRSKSSQTKAKPTLSYAEVHDKLKELSSIEKFSFIEEDSSILPKLSSYCKNNQFTEDELREAMRAILLDDGYSVLASGLASCDTAEIVFRG